MVRVRDGGGKVGRERGRCAGMCAEPPPARHFFVDDRADDRVSETKAPWRLRRTDQIGFDKLVEYPEHRCGGKIRDGRDQLGFERLSRHRGGVERQSSIAGDPAQLVLNRSGNDGTGAQSALGCSVATARRRSRG